MGLGLGTLPATLILHGPFSWGVLRHTHGLTRNTIHWQFKWVDHKWASNRMFDLALSAFSDFGRSVTPSEYQCEV